MKRTFRISVIVALIALAFVGSAWATGPEYGNSAASAALASGAPFTVTDMLRLAAEDEYLAHGEYAAIMQKFGTMRPYDNIMAARWLGRPFRRRGAGPSPLRGSADWRRLCGPAAGSEASPRLKALQT